MVSEAPRMLTLLEAGERLFPGRAPHAQRAGVKRLIRDGQRVRGTQIVLRLPARMLPGGTFIEAAALAKYLDEFERWAVAHGVGKGRLRKNVAPLPATPMDAPPPPPVLRLVGRKGESPAGHGRGGRVAVGGSGYVRCPLDQVGTKVDVRA